MDTKSARANEPNRLDTPPAKSAYTDAIRVANQRPTIFTCSPARVPRRPAPRPRRPESRARAPLTRLLELRAAWITAATLHACAAGCGTAGGDFEDPPSAGDAPDRIVMDGLERLRLAWDLHDTLTLRPESGEAFVRAGVRFDAAEKPTLEYRAAGGRHWTAWQPLTIAWNEGAIYNARIELDEPAEALTLRLVSRGAERQAELQFLAIEFFKTRRRSEHLSAPRDNPVGQLRQGLAPASLVNPRSAWQAKATPECGTVHFPEYVTVHHTVTPNNDTAPPESRLRSIQAYHMDSRGWCDIGYHFVVSQDGRLWQGRSDEQRTGAHVGSHNTSNVGVAFLGDFQTAPVPQPMLDSAAQLVQWLGDTYSFPLNRERVLGHREWSDTTECPGDQLLERLQELFSSESPPGNHPPVGSLRAASCVAIEGWVRDPDDPNHAPDAHVYFNSKPGEPGAIGVKVRASRPTEDEEHADGQLTHRFRLPSPLSLHDGDAHAVFAYGVDANGSAPHPLAPGALHLQCPPGVPMGQRRRISGQGAMDAWRFSHFWDLLPAPPSSVSGTALGPPLPSVPRIARLATDASEYWLIDTGFRRPLASVPDENPWGWDLETAMEPLTAAELAQWPVGPEVPARPILVSDGTDLFLMDARMPDAREGAPRFTFAGPRRTGLQSSETSQAASAVDEGCGCRVPAATRTPHRAGLAAAFVVVALWCKRRRRSA